MRADGKFLAVNGKPNFDGTFTAVRQHDGKFLAVDGFPFFDGNFLAVDGNSNFDGKSPLYRHRPPVRYFYVGKFTEHLPEFFLPKRGLTNTPRRRCLADGQLSSLYLTSPSFSSFGAACAMLCYFSPASSSTPSRPSV